MTCSAVVTFLRLISAAANADCKANLRDRTLDRELFVPVEALIVPACLIRGAIIDCVIGSLPPGKE